MTPWIHSLRKEQLLTIAEEFDLDPEGTVKDIRRVLTLVTAGQHTEEFQQRLLDLELLHTRAPSPTKAETDVEESPVGQLSIPPPQ